MGVHAVEYGELWVAAEEEEPEAWASAATASVPPFAGAWAEAATAPVAAG